MIVQNLGGAKQMSATFARIGGMPRSKHTRRDTNLQKGSSAKATFVALLRGVNVGGKNMLPMKDLQAMFIDAGSMDVRTYIQSGNVVFTATPALAREVVRVMPAMIGKRFKFEPAVILRSADEMERIVAANPFMASSAMGVDDRSLHVAFLADVPAKSRIAALDPQRSPGDDFAVRGSCVYLRLGNGAGKTKLTNAYLDSTLQTISTARNWRTTLKLLEIMREHR